jgi:phosphoenolpyruvate carboxykinase (ATP)
VNILGTPSAIGIDSNGLHTNAVQHWNYGTPQLIEEAVKRSEGKLSIGGAFVTATGKHTGRSANDKYIVRDAETENTVWWGKSNAPMTPEAFDRIHAKVLAYLSAKQELFVADLYGGSQPEYRARVRLINEKAWHNAFARTLLVRPALADLAHFTPEFTILHAPGLLMDPAVDGTRSETVIAVNFSKRIICIAGTHYAGEMKKSVFSILNYILPAKGVMPMHCSANIGANGDTAIFFGLSGTGKTTLSADASRTLIGDDEHGWSDTAVFNFEGGCYAKMIKLSAEAEPEIFATSKRFGTILENVVMDEATRELDFDDNSLAENSRGAYPIEFIPNSSEHNFGPVPKNLIMLTADAYGVLPPIARLTPEQAMYHFLSGYTARVAGTEIGVKEPSATFSTCFGAPFMPRHPSIYGNLLKERIARGGVNCWLVNTGWTGGAYGTGSRMPIKITRALLNAALDGSLNKATFRKDANFGFDVPVNVSGVEDTILDPRSTWADGAAYDATAQKLVKQFIDNFAQFEAYVDAGVKDAAPKAA